MRGIRGMRGMQQITTLTRINPEEWYKSYHGDHLHYGYPNTPGHFNNIKAHCGRVMLVSVQRADKTRVSGLKPGRWYKVCSRCFAAKIGKPSSTSMWRISFHWKIRDIHAWDPGRFAIWAIYTHQPLHYYDQNNYSIVPALEFVIERYGQ